MSIATPSPRRLGRAHSPHNGRHRCGEFARDAVFAEFGARFARALDQANFVDRLPDAQMCLVTRRLLSFDSMKCIAP